MYSAIINSTGENMENKDLLEFIKQTESRFFRTDCDTGANPQVLMIWNQVRAFAGLHRLKKTDLPTFCKICKKYHTGHTGLCQQENK